MAVENDATMKVAYVNWKLVAVIAMRVEDGGDNRNKEGNRNFK